MKILIDMNLAATWVGALERHGWQCTHWSAVGDSRAPDSAIMAWAQANGYIILTHDLDFGTILATTQASGPSVVLIRARSTRLARLENLVVRALQQFEPLLGSGRLVVLNEAGARALVLPLSR